MELKGDIDDEGRDGGPQREVSLGDLLEIG